MVTALEQDYETRDQAQETYGEADRVPVPVVQVHRQAERARAQDQVEIGETLVDRLG